MAKRHDPERVAGGKPDHEDYGKMNLLRILVSVAIAGAAFWALQGQDSARLKEDDLARYRNLGKAFYENPTTQTQAVDEFKKALDLAPQSARERLNYGLALLRAGKTKEGVAEIEKAQKQDPKIPHTWFNLGIAYKKESEYDKAIAQLEHMAQLAPNEPKTHYNLGVLYKLNGKPDQALKEFETASKLDPNLAGPHFQLYNAYRQAGRTEEGARELKLFQAIKERTKGAAIAEDMEWTFFSEIYETIEPKPANQPPAELKFRDVAIAAKLDPKGAGILKLDFDADGRPDVLAWSSSGIVLLKNGSIPVANSGLEAIKAVISIAAGDFDNDGLPDLCVLTESGAALYSNKKGKFQKEAAPLPAGRFESAVWIDYDHDYDLDLILLGENSKLLRNNGAAGFSDLTADFPFVKGHALRGALFELVADANGTDLVVSYSDRAGVLYRDKLAGKYDAIPLDSLSQGADSVVAYDVDNDGWIDVAASGPGGVSILFNREGKFAPPVTVAGAKGPIAFADLENRGIGDLIAGGAVYRNQGRGQLSAAKSPLTPGIVVESDFDADGRADLDFVRADGSLHLMVNQTETKSNWLRVGLTGVKNLKLAPFAKVEVKAGALYQKRIYEGVPLTFGMSAYKDADTVRITWPNGLIQNEPKQPVGKGAIYKEAQRLSGSCPMIFTWDGKQFQFITDVLGVAPLGASAGDGKYFPVDHDEYVQIRGESLAVTDGSYDIRITEELREVSYLDQIRLIAVDHLAGIDIFTNDKFKSPPFPEFRLFGASRRVYPAVARDQKGSDVTARLLHRDRAYPDSFARTYGGVAERHHLDLDFGRTALDNRAALVLNGWVDWADGSTFLASAQESKDGLILPYLQVKDAAGKWQTVIEDMGIPAGKPKTIAVDLTGKFLSASREVRIVTNLCIYWDEIFLIEDSSAPQVTMTPVDAALADLRFRGFSKPTIHPERKQPESFDYSRTMPVSMWNPTPGLYTRYGDVRPLITGVDDRLLIMGSGDELRLQFPVASLPKLQSGWKRDFLLKVDGWAKDGDANTAYSQSVAPLPFHGMSQYPYSGREQFPDSEIQRMYTTRPALRLLRSLASGE
jgi:tetratricopeptide (TPR) repeat protein